MIKYYKVHNLLAFKVSDNTAASKRVFKNWDIELQGFAAESMDSVDLTFDIGNFEPANGACTILDDHFYLRENYFCCDSDSYSSAIWRIEICGMEQDTTAVKIHPNFSGKRFIPEVIIHPIIWFKLNNMGYPVIHGSAVSQNGKAIVFAGQSGARKTAITLYQVENGFKLISEHFVLLGQNNVLSLPTPFHIMDFNLDPLLERNMSAKDKASFRLKHWLCRLTGTSQATKILPNSILPQSLADKARLDTVILLMPREEFKVSEISSEDMVEHLLNIQQLETSPFDRYLVEYAALFPQSKSARYWSSYRENLNRALSHVRRCYKVEVPQKYDEQTLHQITKLVT